MKKLLIIAVLVLLILPTSARATEDVTGNQMAELEIAGLKDSLKGDASDILEDTEIKDGSNFPDGIKKVIAAAGEHFGGILRKGVTSAAIIIVIAILTSLSETLYDGFSSGSVPSFIPLVGTIAISAVAVGDVGSFLKLGSDTISQLSTFSKALLPTLTAAAAASGALTSAAAKFAATALFMDILITIAERALVPLIYAYTAAVIANAAIGGEGFAGAVNVLKWIAVTVLTSIVLFFVAYITVTGVITGSADAVTARVAKTAISTVLPVVGGIISDAASTIIAGAGMVRNAVGVFGLLAIAAICAVPFLNLAVQYMCYKFAAGITAALAGGRIAKLIGGIGTAFGMMLGVTGSTVVLMYFSIISLIKAVSG